MTGSVDVLVRKRLAPLFALLLIAGVMATGPLASPARANHPANSCIDLSPESATTQVGSSQTITATLRTLEGGRCTGAPINPTNSLRIAFELTGPNDSDGNTPENSDFNCTISKQETSCQVSYTPTKEGTDTIVGWIDHDKDQALDADEPKDTVTRTATAGPPNGPTCPGFENDPRNQIVGTPGNDTLYGTGGADIICGLRGDDTIYGRAGKDLILGGRGSDILKGGRDNDRLRGGGGNDVLFGGPGGDRLFGGVGDDYLTGGRGNDVLRGGDGSDHMDGAAGTDRCVGGPGRDFRRHCER